MPPPSLIQPHDPTSPWRTYRILRGEQGVFNYEPYKSALLPLWRFRTAAIARASSTALWEKYLAYESRGDFVGMDLCRKFLQMGMTRSLRYRNWKGGRKGGGDGGVVRVKGEGMGDGDGDGDGDWEGRKEKEEAAEVFRGVWERVRGREGYQRARGEFLRRQREWDRGEKEREKEKGTGMRKREWERMADGVEGEGGDEVALGNRFKDGERVRGGRGQEEEGKRRSKRGKKG